MKDVICMLCGLPIVDGDGELACETIKGLAYRHKSCVVIKSTAAKATPLDVPQYDLEKKPDRSEASVLEENEVEKDDK
jgi:hypothetical protein